MGQKNRRRAFSLTYILVFILGACNLPDESIGLEGKPGALYTEAAMTVSVQLTAVGIDLSNTTQLSETPAPDGPQGADPI